MRIAKNALYMAHHQPANWFISPLHLFHFLHSIFGSFRFAIVVRLCSICVECFVFLYLTHHWQHKRNDYCVECCTFIILHLNNQKQHICSYSQLIVRASCACFVIVGDDVLSLTLSLSFLFLCRRFFIKYLLVVCCVFYVDSIIIVARFSSSSSFSGD